MPLFILENDITQMHVDAVVNAANSKLQMGGGVCGAIFDAAGANQLQKACKAIAPIQTGEAVITEGFNLPARFIIHAVGPIYDRNNKEKCECSLRNAYLNSLQLAVSFNCESIAFPLISSGIYGYPRAEALRIARETIAAFLETHELSVYLVIYSRHSFDFDPSLTQSIGHYLKRNYDTQVREGWRYEREDQHSLFTCLKEKFTKPASSHTLARKTYVADKDEKIHYQHELCSKLFSRSLHAYDTIDSAVKQLDEPFNQTLLKLIQMKGKTEVEVYRRANIDRKHFSKIRSGNHYMPSKKTILALAIALELSRDEVNALLEKAGFALSKSILSDVIILYFIEHKRYNIFEINEVLFKYDQPLLGF